MNQSENPYAPPDAASLTPAPSRDKGIETVNPLRIFVKWMIICVISAGPSFVWGLMISNQEISHILGMVAGVMLFILAYTFLECTPQVQRLLKLRFVKRTAKIGYISRLVVSIIFPIGMYLDVVFGIGAVAIGSAIFGEQLGSPAGDVVTSPLLGFFSYLFTTVVQGIFLNAALFVFMLLVYGICWIFAWFQETGA